MKYRLHPLKSKIVKIMDWINSEKVLERRLANQVKRMKGLCVKIHSANVNGLPDRLILLPGNKHFFVELKSKGKTPSPVQEVMIKRLRERDCRVEVIDTIEKLENFLKEIENA